MDKRFFIRLLGLWFALLIIFGCSQKEELFGEIDKETMEKENREPEYPEPDSSPRAEPIELTLKQSEMSSADNRFAFSMFKEISANNGDNTFFSPLSLNMALGMLYNGASGDARTEMADVLGFAGFTELEINEYYRKMSQSLLEIDPLTDIGIANSIWYREGYPVKQPFVDINKTYFDAMVRPLDFSRPDAPDTINSWCAEKTKDKIKEIIHGQISFEVKLYLINALYFKSKWEYEFDQAKTKQDDFTKTDNGKVKVEMMEQNQLLPYYADQYLECVEMPYGNEAFSMVAVLPANNMDIDQLIDYLDDVKWQNIVDNLHWRDVSLKLPKFKIECEFSLDEPVWNVGIQKIFGGGLYNISDGPLAVSEIRQKTFVEVNEEGTEAAAVTIIAITDSEGGSPYTPVPFHANRPFLYLIKEKSTGVILFIGRMDEPVN